MTSKEVLLEMINRLGKYKAAVANPEVNRGIDYATSEVYKLLGKVNATEKITYESNMDSKD